MKTTIYIILAFYLVGLTGCDYMFSPEDENIRNREDLADNAAFAEGLLLNAYVRLPGNYSFDDVATDDAVTNDVDNSYLKMATGTWSSISNPMSAWDGCFTAIQYLNLMLEESDNIQWATSGEGTKEMFNDRIKGECYGLRALHMFYLLRAHSGRTSDGQLLGFPIITISQNGESDFNIPRNTFSDCIKQIYNDIDRAIDLLPLDFEDIANDSQVPDKYAGVKYSEYNRVFGSYNRQRMSARIAMAIRSKVSLLAASPAYDGTNDDWIYAADAAGDVLDLIGGTAGIADNGYYWYSSNNAGEINNIGEGLNPKEILWRGNISESNSLESDNYPPTLYGNGRVNPTQNLVDAFPMKNGYPINDTSHSFYNSETPYSNRDPRLLTYIIVNGSEAGPSSSPIITEVGKGNDAINAISTSTRTGYYLRKLLREDVNLSPTSSQSQIHYFPRIRYTEIFLNYAEAANRAWGPDGKGSHGYSAREVIGAIRKRAGITQPDRYLESIISTEDMETLIRNERRIELCFEGFRFWDLRRWNCDLTEPAKGVRVMGSIFHYFNVENRNYQPYMNYGPIPYDEVKKWSQLQQNAGW